MKEIKREQLEASIKKAFEEGCSWCQLGIGHCYRLMISADDATVWADLLDENHWKVYQNDNIFPLYSVESTTEEMESNYLEDAVTRLIAAGWEIK